MAFPEERNIDALNEEIQNIQDELSQESRGAVLIKDPKLRRKCPVCEQNIYLYNINFEEMFLMCENTDCEFPFGYEALQVVNEEDELHENPVQASNDFYEYPTTSMSALPRTVESILGAPTGSMSSVSGLSDCDGLSHIDADDLSPDKQDTSLDKQDMLAARLAREDIKRRKLEHKKIEVHTNLNRIKELTEEMSKLIKIESEFDSQGIKNKKWLKNLKTWEMETGQKLLTDKDDIESVENVPKHENELKISISPADVAGASTSYNIQILQYNVEGTKKTSDSDGKDDQ